MAKLNGKIGDIMKILITGNLGYVGSFLVPYLRNNFPDSELIGYDIGYFSNALMPTPILPEIYLNKQYYGDIRSFDKSILKDVDIIIHLAAISNDPMGNLFEDVTNEVNFEATKNIAKLAKDNGVKKFLFPSSCSVYGFTDGNAKNELSELNPLTAYAKSKINAESALSELASNQFKIIAFRFATACGFSPRLRFDLVLNDFIINANLYGKIEIKSDGTPWRPLISLSDMAKAFHFGIISVLENSFQIFNTGSNEWNFTVIELAQKIKELLPSTVIKVNPTPSPDRRSYRVNFDLYKSMASTFYPGHSISKEITWFLEKLKIIDLRSFESNNYVRINSLNKLIDFKIIGHELRFLV